MSTFPLQCAPPADVLARHKPHLRLHYTPPGAAGNRSGMFPWSVEYVRGPASRWVARGETYSHATAFGAIAAAGLIWF